MNRAAVFIKCLGLCAYCGKELGARWHVDHLVSKHRGGSDDESNLMPACARCNRWKATFTLDEFRQEIAVQAERLTKYSGPFRMAVDFGVIEITEKRIRFYFESLPSTPSSLKAPHSGMEEIAP